VAHHVHVPTDVPTFELAYPSPNDSHCKSHFAADQQPDSANFASDSRADDVTCGGPECHSICSPIGGTFSKSVCCAFVSADCIAHSTHCYPERCAICSAFCYTHSAHRLTERCAVFSTDYFAHSCSNVGTDHVDNNHRNDDNDVNFIQHQHWHRHYTNCRLANDA